MAPHLRVATAAEKSAGALLHANRQPHPPACDPQQERGAEVLHWPQRERQGMATAEFSNEERNINQYLINPFEF